MMTAEPFDSLRPKVRRMTMTPIISVAIPTITFVLMMIVGSDLQTADFRRLLRRSSLIWGGLLVPPLVLPPIALALIAITRPPLATATGLLLIATCPVGGISNTYAYLARASTALSVLLTAMSCLMAVVTVPLVGTAIGYATRVPSVTRVPIVPLLVQLLVTVALPASAGMVARSRWPEAVGEYRSTLQRVVFVLLSLLLALIIASDLAGFVDALPHTVPLAAIFVTCSFLIGGAVGHALGGELPDRVTLAIEFATRNVAVATMIAVIVLGRVDFATFGTAYFLTELPLMAVVTVVLRRVLSGDRPDTRNSVFS
jgi:BASS family bile acid:Na+ symporter